MDNQPAIDRSILLPIGIGGISIVGILVVLLIGRSLNSPAQIAVTPSATPFQYVFIGTEPAIVTAIFGGSEIPFTGEPIEEPIEATPNFATPTRSTVAGPIILTPSGTASTPTGGVLRTNTPATSTLSSPVAANTYDDTDSRLAYTGNWVPQTNVTGAYQNTLHISEATGNSVSFAFTGQEIQLYYQAGASLGTVTITFDNQPLAITLNQSQTTGVWTYMLETAGAHTVVITHASGGSVNIDRLVIPSPTVTGTVTVTVTPTRTFTPTPP